MAIQIIHTEAELAAIPDPKNVWRDIGRIVVYTGEDIPAPAVPQSVTPRQIRLALNAAGLRDQVEAAVAAADQGTKDTWEFASEVLRTDPLLVTMAHALGLTDEQIDALFVDAAAR